MITASNLISIQGINWLRCINTVAHGPLAYLNGCHAI